MNSEIRWDENLTWTNQRSWICCHGNTWYTPDSGGSGSEEKDDELWWFWARFNSDGVRTDRGENWTQHLDRCVKTGLKTVRNLLFVCIYTVPLILHVLLACGPKVLFLFYFSTFLWSACFPWTALSALWSDTKDPDVVLVPVVLFSSGVSGDNHRGTGRLNAAEPLSWSIQNHLNWNGPKTTSDTVSGSKPKFCCQSDSDSCCSQSASYILWLTAGWTNRLFTGCSLDLNLETSSLWFWLDQDRVRHIAVVLVGFVQTSGTFRLKLDQNQASGPDGSGPEPVFEFASVWCKKCKTFTLITGSVCLCRNLSDPMSSDGFWPVLLDGSLTSPYKKIFHLVFFVFDVLRIHDPLKIFVFLNIQDCKYILLFHTHICVFILPVDKYPAFYLSFKIWDFFYFKTANSFRRKLPFSYSI